MRALVTGGAGFLGSHLARRLVNQGWQVTVVDNLFGGWEDNVPLGSTFARVDITDHRRLNELYLAVMPDVVFHFAAYAALGVSHWVRRFNYEQNLLGSINLLNCALEYGAGRFVFASSTAVYGNQSPPFTEETPPSPSDPYAVAKAAVERDLAIAGTTHGLDWTIIRPHNVYGPNQNLGDRYRNVVAIFMRQAMNGEPLTIYNDGKQTRAFSYVGDIIDPIILAATLPTTNREVINIGGETPHTILDIAHAVQSEIGDTGLEFMGPRHEVEKSYPAHDKARGLLGFHPETELSAGIKMMAIWARLSGETRWTKTPRIEVSRALPDYWRTKPPVDSSYIPAPF